MANVSDALRERLPMFPPSADSVPDLLALIAEGVIELVAHEEARTLEAQADVCPCCGNPRR